MIKLNSDMNYQRTKYKQNFTMKKQLSQYLGFK